MMAEKIASLGGAERRLRSALANLGGQNRG
jgi:hypothetical protein